MAFQPLYEAFLRWAPHDESVGWAIGDAMASAASSDDLPALLQIAGDTGYRQARQMVVYALARFKPSPDVKPSLLAVLADPDVALHAMSALRRSIGAKDALPYLREVEAQHRGDPLGQTATREIRKAEKSLRPKRR